MTLKEIIGMKGRHFIFAEDTTDPLSKECHVYGMMGENPVYAMTGENPYVYFFSYFDISDGMIFKCLKTDIVIEKEVILLKIP